MGVLPQAQQSKAASLLQKQMIKPRKRLLKARDKQIGRRLGDRDTRTQGQKDTRRCGFGISKAFWYWLTGMGQMRGGHCWVQLVQGGPVLCQELHSVLGLRDSRAWGTHPSAGSVNDGQDRWRMGRADRGWAESVEDGQDQ